MTISLQQALADADSLKTVSESYQLDAELLLSHVIEKPREYLKAHSEDEVSEEHYTQFQALIARRQKGEPVAYLVGHKAFWDFDLQVNESVLIPRPETEVLVELCLTKLENSATSLRIADLGTGSGAIAIALARANTDWQVHAVELSKPALVVAQSNAKSLAVNNIEFHLGSWCDGLPGEKFDLIVANPPYVEPGDKHLQQDGLPFEPTLAQVAEDSGFAAQNKIMHGAINYLKKDAWLLMEHGYNQQQQLLKNLVELGFGEVEGHKDYAGVERVVQGRWISE